MDRRPCPPRAPRCPRWWALLALLASSGCVYLRGTAEQPAVLSFRIEGMKKLDEGDLKQRLATQESRRSPPVPIVGPLLHQVAGLRQDLSGLTKPPPIPVVGPILYGLRGSAKNELVSPLDRDQLAVDRQRVEAYYRDHGYYDARVVDTQVTPVGEGQVAVTLKVEEGQPVRVTRLAIDGIEAAPEAQAALRKPALREGDVFTVEAYDAFREQLAAALRNNGWPTGEVTQEAQVLPEEHGAIVRYGVEPGKRFRFGPLFVAGTASVPRDKIRQRAGDEIHPGQWYDESKLATAQARVYAMGVFGGVRVNRGTPDPERGIIPIVVAVREAPFRSVRLGPSLGVVSNSRFDVSGVAGWTHRNFLGGLRKLDLSLSAGWAWLLTRPYKSGPIGTAAADFSQPEIAGRNVDLALHADVQRGIEQAYDFWAERGRVAFPIRLTRRLTFVPSYNLELYQLTNVPTAEQTDTGTSPITSQVLSSCVKSGPASTRGVCLLSYLEQRLEWDGRDDPINTRRGVYAAFAVQEGGHLGGYGYTYLRFLPEVRAYLPIGERSVLAARARVGAFVPVNETRTPPVVALFEAGGPNSVRGYGWNRLSPMCGTRDPTTGRCLGDWTAVGGNGLADYSLELRFPVRGNLFGAVFTDAGYVSYPSAVPTAWRQALDPSRLQFATGVGIRYRTPVGPLRVDLAARLPTDLSSGVGFEERFPAIPSISQGRDPDPHREPILALHLTVGEAY